MGTFLEEFAADLQSVLLDCVAGDGECMNGTDM